MSGPPEIALRELCRFVNGKAFKPTDWSTDGHPIIRIQNLNKHSNGFNYWAGDLSRRILVKPGDLLLAWSGTPGTSFGAHVWNGPVGVLNQHIFRVELDEAKIDRDYCLYTINSRLDELISKAHGGVGLQHFTKGVIEQLKIPLPPLGEQRRIVDLLERAAGIRRLREQALAKARAIVPAHFLDMFGDSATNPKGWPSSALGSLIAGLQGGRNLQSGDEGVSRFRILRISAVTGGTFRPEESKPAPLGYAPPPEHFVRVGDLLITRANTVDLVGAVAQVYGTPTNLLLPDKIWRFLWLENLP